MECRAEAPSGHLELPQKSRHFFVLRRPFLPSFLPASLLLSVTNTTTATMIYRRFSDPREDGGGGVIGNPLPISWTRSDLQTRMAETNTEEWLKHRRKFGAKIREVGCRHRMHDCLWRRLSGGEREEGSVIKTPNISAIREMRAFCQSASLSTRELEIGRGRAFAERTLFVFSKDDEKTATVAACGVTGGCRWLPLSTSPVSSRSIQFVDIIKCTFREEEEEKED